MVKSVSFSLVAGIALSLPLALAQEEPACEPNVRLGFSLVEVDSAVPFDSTFGMDGGATFDVSFPVGMPGQVDVYVNVISQLEGEDGIQGWSLSLALDGAAELVSAERVVARDPSTCVGLPGCDDRPIIVDPAQNQGQRGVIDALVLSPTTRSSLPPVGTRSLLKLVVRTLEPPPPEGSVARLWFLDGLKGTGLPIQNALTYAGATVSACNLATASIDIRFSSVHSDSGFVRGDANDDGRVDIADAIWVLSELFLGGPRTICRDAADANDDAREDLSDSVHLLSYLFLGGPGPRPPFPGCGRDPTDSVPGATCGAQSHCP